MKSKEVPHTVIESQEVDIGARALRYRGSIHTGIGHMFALEKLIKDFPDCLDKENEKDIERGSIDTNGEFVLEDLSKALEKSQNEAD